MNRPWNWQDDERFNREFREFDPASTAAEELPDTVPNYLYDEMVAAFCRECAVTRRLRESNAVLQRELRNRSGLWKAALKDAARNRRYAIGSTVIAAAWAIVAWIGWAR